VDAIKSNNPAVLIVLRIGHWNPAAANQRSIIVLFNTAVVMDLLMVVPVVVVDQLQSLSTWQVTVLT
jgi:hypothetical protein